MRGSPEVKENTIEAFDLALQHGCHGFEFDVRLTGDRRAVICHDPAVDRVKVDGARSGQLGNLALLQQVFERFHSSAFMDVELKVAGLENCVAEIAREFPPERGFVISSFLPEVLERLHPELPFMADEIHLIFRGDAHRTRAFVITKDAILAHGRTLDGDYEE